METPIYHLEKVVRTKDEGAEDFNGPLDLILSLLAKNKMEIQDIQIALILDQYLAWMERRRKLELEVASEFIIMAAQLMFIKSRMLLSVHDEEALSELDQLIASLEEHQRHENYARIQQVLPLLVQRGGLAQDHITKAPEALPLEKEYRYRHEPEELRKALLQTMDRLGGTLPPAMAAFEGIVGKEPYPVGDKASEIMDRLRRFGMTRFQALFRGSRSRSEVVATFLAVLELCKARRLRLSEEADGFTVMDTGEGEPEMEFTSDVY